MVAHLLHVTLLLGVLASQLDAYKIAVFTRDMANSHVIWHKRVSEALAKAGHNVTMIKLVGFHWSKKQQIPIDPSVTVWNVGNGSAVTSEYGRIHSEMAFTDSTIFGNTMRHFMNHMMKNMQDNCEQLITNKPFLEQLKAEKFDVAFVQMFEACPIGLVHHARIPAWIWLNAGQLLDNIANVMGVPQPASYVPAMMFDMKDEMTFMERAQNLVVGSLMSPFWKWRAIDPITRLYRKHIDPNFPDIAALGAECSLVMVNSNEMYEIPRPTLHKIVNIGGLGMEKKDAKELTGDFKRIVDGAENVVLFSFGSIANASAMPESWKRAFMTVFSRFPDHEFILRYVDHDMDAFKPPNVHLFKWIPQSDLLQHPKTRAMISHGGYNSLQETINAGKPIVTIPLFADQKRNGRLAEKHGIGYYLHKATLTEETLQKAVETILRHPSYAVKARRMQQMVEKKPIKADELLVKWTEFLAEFQLLPNLVPYGTKLSFIIYHNLDVLAALAGILISVIFIPVLLLRCLCCRQRPRKLKIN
ncbi:hypothetical protein QR680_016653 [Steinernema hermaphroditum]|uniref:UDP-glucuronosyltransferase n=1 Tax=Steinernema hermaphroditum TaxID=289476 RepID=A0AA39HBV5_9BILA|nr:hypothetical protein QR680_016653 [Steinernema hermaphroditum]